MWQVLGEFKELFPNELSDELPPRRALNHHIDIDTTSSISDDNDSELAEVGRS
jgi:hypothetical protein